MATRDRPETAAGDAVPVGASEVPAGDYIVGPAALKGVAHPLRLRLLAELGERGRATASQLAAALGESSGATSYHLRQLHRHGFVVEEPGVGTARERYWRTRPGGWTMPLLDFSENPATAAAAAVILHEQLQQDAGRHLRAVAAAPQWPAPWREALLRREVRLTLTAEQAQALNVEIGDLLERYRGLPGGPGARRVIVTADTVPTDHLVGDE